MRSKSLALSPLAAILTATLTASAANPPPLLPFTQMAPGMVSDPTEDSCAASYLGGGNTGAVSVWIVWYNAAGHVWTSPQQTLVTGWLAGLTASQWGSIFQAYPNGTVRSAAHEITSVVLGGTDTVADSLYGVTFGPTAGSNDGLAIDGEVTLGNLPAGAGIYYVLLPSYTDCFFTNGATGHNTTSPNAHAYASAVRVSGSTFPSPNSDSPFDEMMYAISHEIAEGLLAWGTSCSGSQIMDPCQAGFFSNTFKAPGSGAMANYTATCGGSPCYFTLQDAWIGSQGGYCYQGIAPPSLVTWCRSNADCAWSKRCVGWACAAWSCSDGIKNGAEADVDCGTTCGLNGSWLSTCASGKHCNVDNDCSSGVCTASVCN